MADSEPTTIESWEAHERAVTKIFGEGWQLQTDEQWEAAAGVRHSDDGSHEYFEPNPHMAAWRQQIDDQLRYVYERMLARGVDITADAVPVQALERALEMETNPGGRDQLSTLAIKKEAPDVATHSAIREAYRWADASGAKPPNVKEIGDIVQRQLRAIGLDASKRRIGELAADSRYDGFRLKRGEKFEQLATKKPLQR
jgi:hypothetical protein